MSPIEAYAARFGVGYKWLATITVMLATTATTAASTMVNVALPTMVQRRDRDHKNDITRTYITRHLDHH